MYESADKIICKHFDLQITKNTLISGNQKQQAVESTFNIEFNKTGLVLELNKILDDCCTISKTQAKPKTLAQMTEAIWRKCKIDNKSLELKIDQIVLGKMKGYSQ